MEYIREFEPADRYVYDFGACSAENGFAQVDTAQDASYFGTWCSPSRLAIVTYCEGDVTLAIAKDAEEFAAEIRRIKSWNVEHGLGPIHIDPGFNEELKQQIEAMGLADLLH